MNDPHVGFIVAAYALAALIILAMIASVWVDYRRLRQALERLRPDAGSDERDGRE
jgi:heme exporter protein CcmD